MIQIEAAYTFRVIDLKQYVYCPRILYYHTVLPHIRPTTYKMEEGILIHSEINYKEKRRLLRTYGLKEGKRYFNVAVQDADLGLSGEIDMVIETADELIPVDFKNTHKTGDHFKLQLMAYGRLLELDEARPTMQIKRGFLYLIPQRKAIEVRFTPTLRQKLTDALAIMRRLALTQYVPEPTTKRGRCVDCEFRRFCNDVI